MICTDRHSVSYAIIMPFQCFGIAIVHGLSTCSWSTDPVLLRLSLTGLDHCQDQEMDPQ